MSALLYVPLTAIVTAWATLAGPRTCRRLQTALRGTFAQHADQAIAITGPPAPGRAPSVPAPGRQTPAAAGTPPLPPPPGPNLLSMTLRTFTCGCVYQWGRTRQIEAAHICGGHVPLPGNDWDEWAKGLMS